MTRTIEKVVLDANVLYGAFLRDLLLWLFVEKLYEAKWTDEINDEWARHLVENNGNVDPRKIIKNMNSIPPNPLVTDYRHLIDTLKLPDSDDKHVLAAAIVAKACKIVTWNIKDFPQRVLTEFGIIAENPDKFMSSLIISAPEQAVAALRKARTKKVNPAIDVDRFFSMLEKHNLKQTAKELARYRDML